MGADLFDDLAQAISKPMPRRRALWILAAGVGAAVAPGMTGRWAFAADPPPPCTTTGGSFCGNVNPLGKKGYNIGCCRGAGNPRTVCCPGIPGVVGSLCCPTGYTCGNTSADSKENCKCASGVVCAGTCCKSGEYCQTQLIGTDFCDKKCPHTGEQKCNGVCCTSNEECGFFGCGCKSGLVSTGAGTCVKPREDPGDPKPGWNPFRNMFNMMGQSSAAHGASGSSASFLRPSQTGFAAVDAAKNALAAVNGQGAAAMLSIREGKRDPAFRRAVTVARVKPPKLFAGDGLDAGSVAALNSLLIAEARANALIAAMAKALWRARAAHAKGNATAAKRQLRASATFAGQAVTALKRVQTLRPATANALTAGKVAEVYAFDEAVAEFAATVKAGGIPPSLRAPMAKLGVGSAELEYLRSGVNGLAVTSAVGPVLIAPLRDTQRATELKGLVTELSHFSTRARKHPIAR